LEADRFQVGLLVAWRPPRQSLMVQVDAKSFGKRSAGDDFQLARTTFQFNGLRINSM
jgi:hypothetical protein